MSNEEIVAVISTILRPGARWHTISETVKNAEDIRNFEILSVDYKMELVKVKVRYKHEGQIKFHEIYLTMGDLLSLHEGEQICPDNIVEENWLKLIQDQRFIDPKPPERPRIGFKMPRVKFKKLRNFIESASSYQGEPIDFAAMGLEKAIVTDRQPQPEPNSNSSSNELNQEVGIEFINGEEFINSKTLFGQMYLKYFMYLDGDLEVIYDQADKEAKRKNIETTKQDEYLKIQPQSAKKYLLALREIFDKYGQSQVESLVESMYANFLNEAKRILLVFGIGRLNYYSTCKSWIYWDIAKQYYLNNNPDESTTEYKLNNPMENEEIRQNIIDRMIGWDIYHLKNFILNPGNWEEKSENLDPESAPKILAMFKKTPKEDGQLSSADYARLGQLLRGAIKK